MSLAYQSELYPVELEQIIDNLPSAIIVVDTDRRALLANQMAVAFALKSKEAFFGLREEEALGCVNSQKSPEDCGYEPECEFCKIRQAVLETFESRKGKVAVEAEMKFTQMGKVR